MYPDTDVLEVLGSNPGTAVSELCHFRLPHCSLQCLSEETLKIVGPSVMSGAYARGVKLSDTGGKCVTCR